ncbi:hypothetical protein CKA32_003551 [Geitlerinema sp. FC II]|nr:hypothetical protein CKA32_003551 [Geitlerinema sp. FC II]
MMEIKTDDYHIWYEPDTNAVYCQGSLRLSGMAEYAPIAELLDEVVDREPSQIVLDLQGLEFLNSSGISMLSKFVIKVRHKKTIHTIVRGSKAIPWQGKSLKNLQRLMPSLTLEWE